MPNKLYFGDNLHVLREHIADYKRCFSDSVMEMQAWVNGVKQ
ncbi:hypothetical protein [Erythrobacter dokdonensis]|uniref:Uncharacterized protein n=1 Tax=Erythrobacter dokdonensis DSW-74 TaxID=1300349 RepID=A0A1A7BM88_9SPHN|nr:hypothetical protein [Erythrobacter dokdonensis]OBV12270.1 hypothetical protein I603_0401 [Erythrobacter dokdonensis DSW-74]